MARVRVGLDDGNDWVIYPDDFLFGKMVDVPSDVLQELQQATAHYRAVQALMDTCMKEVGYYDLPYDGRWPEGS